MPLPPLQQKIAEALAEYNHDRSELDEAIADGFEADDPTFDRERFLLIAANCDPDYEDDYDDWYDDEFDDDDDEDFDGADDDFFGDEDDDDDVS